MCDPRVSHAGSRLAGPRDRSRLSFYGFYGLLTGSCGGVFERAWGNLNSHEWYVYFVLVVILTGSF